MCGIIGYASDSPKASHAKQLGLLFSESKIRGLHAFGFSWIDGNDLTTKKFSDESRCIESLPKLTSRLIGHCRYSTSGDYKDIENNQPLQIGQTALAFNGVISMATKEENEREYGRRYETDNDGEIFLDKLTRDDGWEEFVARGKFSFAGLALRDGKIIALRNKNRPLYRVDSNGATFFASTADIFKRAGFCEIPQEVPCGVAISVG